jgi:pimeloyl-ACP methyl ester carboxylesterase
VICADLRGFGWTEAPAGGYEPETFAADAAALLSALELDSAALVGHDWGGIAGFLLCLRWPERVRGFLAINTPVPWVRAGPRALAELWRGWYAATVASPRLGERVLRRGRFIERFLRRDLVQPGLSAADAAMYADRLREPARARASAQLYRGYRRLLLDVGIRRRYHDLRLSTPTLLLFGARDFYVSRHWTRGWEGHADHMRVELVPDSGHFLPEERPELVAARALDLFESAR